TDIRGCSDTTIQQVCIPAALQIAVNYDATCIGDTTQFAALLMAPGNDSLVRFEWNFDDMASGIFNTSNLKNPDHYFANSGNYMVSLTATDINNCESTVYENVTINSLPQPEFAYNAGTCDSTLYFTDMSAANGNNIIAWVWNYGDGAIDTITSSPANTSHYYATTGSFNITLTTITSSGCSNIITKQIEKLPCLLAGFTQMDTLICQKSTLQFQDNSLCGNPINNWTWYFGDGNSLNYNTYQPTVEHLYETSGMFNVSLVVSTSLSGVSISDTITQTVVVLPSPTADYKFNDVCLNAVTIFTDDSQWTQSRIESWKWDFGDPMSVVDTSTSRNPAYKYTIAGLYRPLLTVTNQYGCVDTATNAVYVHNYPHADFDYSVACQNSHTFFIDESDSADAAIGQWWWKFKDTLTVLGLAGIQNPDYIFVETGEYEVELMVTNENGCSDTVSKVITVNPKPKSAFSYVENYENEQGKVLFTNESEGARSYEWNFGLGTASFEINPVVTFPSGGDYEVSLVALNEFDCPDTLTINYTLLYKGLWVPNAFSPNNPNAEVRLFKPVGTNLQYYTIEVYDTWGNVLWTSDKIDENGSPAEGWNGIFNGNLLPQDTYMWKASAVFKDGTIWDGKNVGNTEHLPQSSYGTVYLIR
ncbi:MAG: PKD domain-containing protein, partial [Chloroflexota bacterium]